MFYTDKALNLWPDQSSEGSNANKASEQAYFFAIVQICWYKEGSYSDTQSSLYMKNIY